MRNVRRCPLGADPMEIAPLTATSVGDDEPSSIVVYRPGAVGDVIVTFPVLQALRQRYPSATIALVGPETAELALTSGLADRVLSSDAAWVARWFAGDESALTETLGEADTYVVFSHDDDGVLAHAATMAGARRVTVWPARQADDGTQHMSDYLLGALAAWGVESAGNVPAVTAGAGPIAEAERISREAGAQGDYVLVHGGSSALPRLWPKMPELADAIEQDLSRPVLVNVGPVELELGTLARWPKAVRTVGPMPIPVLAGVIAGAKLFVGNDTGPSHVAAGLGVPTVAVFGPSSDARVWAPRGRCAEVVRGASDAMWPTVSEVRAAVARCAANA